MTDEDYKKLTEAEKLIVKNNIARINMWIETHATLQPTSEIVAPLVAAYERETIYKVRACASCIIDCLIWCRIQAHGNPYVMRPELLTEPNIKKGKMKK